MAYTIRYSEQVIGDLDDIVRYTVDVLFSPTDC